MLRSLEKLKSGCWFPAGKDTCNSDYFDTKNIADEIQAEVDKFHLPRPLFEDGEPADFGDEYLGGTIPREIDHIVYRRDGSMEISAVDGTWHYLAPDERLKRPERDTQERIYDDATLNPGAYCRMFGLDDEDDLEQATIKMVLHLLERQRKLCEEER